KDSLVSMGSAAIPITSPLMVSARTSASVPAGGSDRPIQVACRGSAPRAAPKVWDPLMPFRNSRSQRLLIHLHLVANPEVRYQLQLGPERMTFTAHCLSTFAMTC